MLRNPAERRSATVIGMFFAIGFVLSIVVAFVSPYFYQGVTESPALPTAVTTIICWIVLAGGGYLLDRHRRRLAEERASERSSANPAP